MITRGHHRDFVNLELSRQDLARRERESADLAERNRVEATRDPLTGAMNRRGILAYFEAKVVRPGRPLPWLALVDLDGFKLINDTFGHAAGDAVLCAISERIEALPEISGFGRMGGDEFALLLPGGMDHAAVRAALEQLAESIAQPIPFGDRMLAIRASIGLHKCADSNVSGSLERADVALYKAKETRNAAIGDFTPHDEVVMRDKRGFRKPAVARLSADHGLRRRPHCRLRSASPVVAGRSAVAPADRLYPPGRNHRENGRANLGDPRQGATRMPRLGLRLQPERQPFGPRYPA
jgi:diguanylate cyclase (GGDEF)-like protein